MEGLLLGLLGLLDVGTQAGREGGTSRSPKSPRSTTQIRKVMVSWNDKAGETPVQS